MKKEKLTLKVRTEGITEPESCKREEEDVRIKQSPAMERMGGSIEKKGAASPTRSKGKTVGLKNTQNWRKGVFLITQKREGRGRVVGGRSRRIARDLSTGQGSFSRKPKPTSTSGMEVTHRESERLA